MAAQTAKVQLRSPVDSQEGEGPFWHSAGASWRRIAGGFDSSGFRFEWHEWEAIAPLKWSESFHPESVEICLNLQGSGWVAANGLRMDFGMNTVGFFATRGAPLTAERSGGQRHQFLSLEFDIEFLRERLASHREQLDPTICRCLATELPYAGMSGISALTHRQRDLLTSLLRPPVLASAQKL